MKSLAELKAIRDKTRASVTLRENAEAGTRVMVGMATCGIAAGARPVLNAFVEEVAKRNLQDVMVTQTGCIGICQYEPVVEVVTPGHEKVTYVKMTPEKALRVVNDHPCERQCGNGVHHWGQCHRSQIRGRENNVSFKRAGLRRYRLYFLQQRADY